MKYLCLAYGAEEDWKKLTIRQQRELLAQDDVLRSRGAFVSALEPEVTTVTNWNGALTVEQEPFARSAAPLAGFSIIEARDVEEVIRLVANTPCARAGGAIEIRRLPEG